MKRNRKKVRLVINAQLLDTIERAKHAKAFTPPRTKEICLTNDKAKEDFIKAFEESESFELGDGEIYFTVESTLEEIEAHNKKNKVFLNAQVLGLKRASGRSAEYKDQIDKYIEAKELYWLKDLIEENETK